MMWGRQVFVKQEKVALFGDLVSPLTNSFPSPRWVSKATVLSLGCMLESWFPGHNPGSLGREGRGRPRPQHFPKLPKWFHYTAHAENTVKGLKTIARQRGVSEGVSVGIGMVLGKRQNGKVEKWASWVVGQVSRSKGPCAVFVEGL